MSEWKNIVGIGYTPEQFDIFTANITLTDWRPQFIVLHNTATPRLDQWHNVSGAARMQNLQTYYRDTMKWSAGPHLFIDDSIIWTFTPLTSPGVHSPSWNRESWGVEMVGDYDHETFGRAVRWNTLRALSSLCRLGTMDPAGAIRLHKEDPLTTHKHCPGKNVDKTDIIAGVQTLIGLPLNTK